MYPFALGLIAFLTLNMSPSFKSDCLTAFSDEVNSAGDELEADMEHCAEVSYARNLCEEEAGVSYNLSVDDAVDHYIECES